MHRLTSRLFAISGASVACLCLIAGLALTRYAGANDLQPFDAGGENRMGLAFSPDGRTAYWVEWDGDWGSSPDSQRVIYTARLHDGRWGAPEAAPFSNHYSDDDPFVSPDGKWLYFVSERPADNNDSVLDADIWRYSLAEEGHLERLAINSDATEYSPVVTASGTLYFASDRDGGSGQGDIYRATPIDDGFAPAEPLGAAVNSATGEWNVWVSADDSELLFEASSRSTNVSVPGDLYYSWRSPAGWTAAVPVAPLNTSGSDLMARVDPDGTTLYYTTARSGGHARIATANWSDLQRELRSNYAPILLVANRSSHEVTFVDLANAGVVARIPTGDGPHLLSNVSDGRVLATGFGQFPQPHDEPIPQRPPFIESLNSKLTLIDVAEQAVVLDQAVDGCARPHASWIVEQRAYLTCQDEQRVLVFDLEEAATVAFFDTRQDGSHVLGFDPGSRTLSVSNTDSGSLTLIDVDSGDTGIVDLPAGSEGQLVVDGRIWVGNAFAGSISVVDAAAREVVAHTGRACNFPISLDYDGQRHVWVACFGSAELVAINVDSFAIERRIDLEHQPLNLLLHPRLPLAYVSLPRQNAVAEVDLVSGRELRRIRVGIEPDGLRWAVPDM